MPPARGRGDHITVRVDWLARQLAQQQEDVAATEHHRNTVSNCHRVSRVPGHVRDVNPDAYTPGLVSIGPLHAAAGWNGRLRAGSRLKMAYLNSLISRGHPDPEGHLAVIQGYILAVDAREREARAMYAAEDVDELRPEELVQMLVLDGCFIIKHLVNVFTGREEPSLHATSFGLAQLSVDLVLAENQIPFFVLVDLIKSTRLPELEHLGYDPPVLLMKLALYYLAGERGRDMAEGLPEADRVSHLLHLLHAVVTAARTLWEPPPRAIQGGATMKLAQEAARLLWRLPLLLLVPLLYPTLPEECKWRASYGREREGLPSASDLKGMGVRFRKARGFWGSKAAVGIASVLGPVPLAARLEHGDWLRLPQLRIEHRTAPLLLNLMAFEQWVEQRAGDVSAYVWLMAKLARSPEDAGVLLVSEVVQSSETGSESREDVARFFRQVGAASEAAGELDRTSYLRETLEKLQERSRNRPLCLSMVQNYYFDEPLRLAAVFLSVIMTVTSILQTYAAFKQKP